MSSPNAADRVRAAERRARAMQLRQTGASFQQIGTTLGVSPQAAHKAVKAGMAALAKITITEAIEVRAMELDRLDRAQSAIWRQVTQGNLGAIDRLLRIMDRRAKLLGLDAPTKHANTDPSGEQGQAPGLLVLPAEIADVEAWVQQFAPAPPSEA